MTDDELAQRLRTRLGPHGGDLPGEAAQRLMAPQPRASSSPTGDALVDAAVLVLLYVDRGGTHLVLTRRTDTVARHRSQISLPGGRREHGESLEEAALRECAEELAVDPTAVAMLGRLSPLDVHASGFRIHPFVGWTERKPRFSPDPAEVAEVIEVSLRDLLSPPTSRQEMWDHEGVARRVPFYHIQGHKVWGATAMILSELLAVVREAGGPGPRPI